MDKRSTGEEHLQWQTRGSLQFANDGRRLYVRESLESVVGGTAFGVLLMGGLGFLGWRLVWGVGMGTRVVGGAMLLGAAGLLGVLLWQVSGWLGLTGARTRGPLVVFDRGEGGSGAEIRFAGRSLAAGRVRCLATRPAEGGRAGELIRHIVVAELHDGGVEVLGMHAVMPFAGQYAQQGAVWMGLPYRVGEG